MKSIKLFLIFLLLLVFCGCSLSNSHLEENNDGLNQSRSTFNNQKSFEIDCKTLLDLRKVDSVDKTTIDLIKRDGSYLATINRYHNQILTGAIQGILPDGRLVKRVGEWGSLVYDVLDQTQYPWGIDELGNPMVPWKSIAVGKHVAPLGTKMYVKSFDGFILPDGSMHNGWFNVTFKPREEISEHFTIFLGSSENYLYFNANHSGVVNAQWSGAISDYVKIEAESNQSGIVPYPNESIIRRGSIATFSTMVAPCGKEYTLESIFVNGILHPNVGSAECLILYDVQEDTLVKFNYSFRDFLAAEAIYIIEQDWITGFIAVVDIVNNSENNIYSWDVELRYPVEGINITGVWDGKIQQFGTFVKISNTDWNNIIKPGEKVRIRLNGTYETENVLPLSRTYVRY